jgi:hypothetical protein
MIHNTYKQTIYKFYISPTNPLWTPSGLTAKNVLSRFVPGTPYTGTLSHLTVESNEYAAAVATAVEATMARVMGAAAAAERTATEETARTPVEERVATLREAVEARERVAAENMVKVCQSWSIDLWGWPRWMAMGSFCCVVRSGARSFYKRSVDGPRVRVQWAVYGGLKEPFFGYNSAQRNARGRPPLPFCTPHHRPPPPSKRAQKP